MTTRVSGNVSKDFSFEKSRHYSAKSLQSARNKEAASAEKLLTGVACRHGVRGRSRFETPII
jgi:hypothetical protein